MRNITLYSAVYVTQVTHTKHRESHTLNSLINKHARLAFFGKKTTKKFPPYSHFSFHNEKIFPSYNLTLKHHFLNHK